MTDFVVGDSRPYVVQLTINEESFVINPVTDMVKAAIVSEDRSRLLCTSAILLSSAAPGGDWAESKVVVKFPRAHLSGVKKATEAVLEVQVTFGYADEATADDWTWFIPVNLVLAQIP